MFVHRSWCLLLTALAIDGANIGQERLDGVMGGESSLPSVLRARVAGVHSLGAAIRATGRYFINTVLQCEMHVHA